MLGTRSLFRGPRNKQSCTPHVEIKLSTKAGLYAHSLKQHHHSATHQRRPQCLVQTLSVKKEKKTL